MFKFVFTGTRWSPDGLRRAAPNDGTQTTVLPAEASGPANQTLSPSIVGNTSTFFAPTISVGAVVLSHTFVVNGQTFYAPSVTQFSGLQTLAQGARFDNTQTIFSAVVLPGSVSVFPTKVENTSLFYPPSVAAGAVSVSAPRFDNLSAFYQPTISVAYGVVPPYVTTTSIVFTPTTTHFNELLFPSYVEPGYVEPGYVEVYGFNRNEFPSASISPGVVEISAPLLQSTNVFFGLEIGSTYFAQPAGRTKTRAKNIVAVDAPPVVEEVSVVCRVLRPSTGVSASPKRVFAGGTVPSRTVQRPFTSAKASSVTEECGSAFRVVTPFCGVSTSAASVEFSSISVVARPTAHAVAPRAFGFSYASGGPVEKPNAIQNPTAEMLALLF